jgi:tetratricopeptide (TPR) repeat protein
MSHPKGRYFMILLIAGLTTGALEPKTLTPTLEQEEYLAADDWFQVGLNMNSEGKYQEAADAFARSIAIEPSNSLSWLSLGTAQALLGKFDPAIEALKHAVQLNPKLALGYANLAEVCFRAYRFQEAVDAYRALLELWPDNANAVYKLGLAYLSLNDAAKAQAEYLSLKTMNPELAEKLLKVINSGANH